MNTKSHARLALFAWVVFTVVLLATVAGFPHVGRSFGSSVGEDMANSYMESLAAAREEAKKKPNRDEWMPSTKVSAGMVGAALLQTTDENLWKSYEEAARKNVESVSLPLARLSSFLQWVSSVLLLYALWGLARLASAYRRGSADDGATARVFRRTAAIFWWRAPLTMATALCAIGVDWQVGKTMWGLGAPVTGVFSMPNSFYQLSTQFLPDFAGATAIVVGALFYTAAKVLESRGQMEKDLEGTV